MLTLQDSISFVRSLKQQEIYYKYIEKYLQSYPDIAQTQKYLPSSLEALEVVKQEAEFYQLEDLKNAASEEYERIEAEEFACKTIKDSRGSVPAAFRIIMGAVKCLLGEAYLSGSHWNDLLNSHNFHSSRSTQVEIRCHKLGFFSPDGTAEMFEFTEAEVVVGGYWSTKFCDVVRVSKEALCKCLVCLLLIGVLLFLCESVCDH